MNEARTVPRLEVDSSNLKSIGYAEDRQILALEFISGSIYHYRGVPPEVFEAFGAAPSRGAFFAKQIKGKFTAERMDGLCAKCGEPGLVGEPCACGQGVTLAISRRKE